MEEFELKSLILKGESSTLQFKKKLSDVKPCDDLARDIVAFLNHRGGKILIGVVDDGSIFGLNQEQVRSANQSISNAASQHVVPGVTVDTENVLTNNGLVIVLTVEEGIDKPYQTNRGEFYVKTGADKRHVTHRDELRRLFQVGSHVFAEKQPVRGSELSQIDFGRYRNFYEQTNQSDAPEDEKAILSQMRALHLVAGDELTLAGCLLFTRNPQSVLPQFTAKGIWINGTDISSNSYRDHREFAGPLSEMYRQAYDFLDAWNLRQQPEGKSYNVSGKSIIPPNVFEEILTNAFIHRDYFVPDSIKIFIFDDRIEIYSPGTLPNSLTVEEAVLAGITRKRNPIIEQIGLTLMQYKGHGSGLPRVKHIYPKIQFCNDLKRNAFIVIIPL